MARQFVLWQPHHVSAKAYRLCLSLMLMVALMGCTPDSDTGTRPPQPDPTDLQFVRQAVTEVVDLYQVALRNGDIDRLQPLLRQDDARQAATILGTTENAAFRSNGCPELTALTADQYLDGITGLLQRFRVLSHHTQILDMDTSSTEPTVSLQETISLEDTASADQTRLAQRTCVSTLNLRLTRQAAQNIQGRPGVIITSFLITEVIREGPVFQVEMPGLSQAGALARIEVAEITDTFSAQQVMLKIDTQDVPLQPQGDGIFRGAIFLSDQVTPPPLQLVISGERGEEVIFQHVYQTRQPQALAVQRITGTAGGGLLTLVEGADGTIWAGDREAIYRIEPEAMAATRAFRLNLRVSDLVIDVQERLHAIVFSPQRGGVIVPLGERLCQTVNAFANDYPFTTRDPVSGADVPSASTRAITASDGGIWLFGSDGGVARVTDELQLENCLNNEVPIDYDPIFRRQDPQSSQLLTNTVLAFVESQDGALWFGTALGLMRFQDEQFTSIPFDPVLSIAPGQLSQDQLGTLESFIGSVSEAIFASQPIETVMIGDLSFLDFFDRALVKEDFIFSAVEDRQNRLWVGTVGGGLRRIEAVGDTFQDTLNITRMEVSRIDPATRTRVTADSQGQLLSNIIFALASGPSGDVWAATDKGVSRIQEQVDGTVVITNYTALDGLNLPVRDVLVSDSGIVWLATDGGVYKLTSESAQLQGTVMHVTDQSDLGSPVEGADVILRNMPFRAVTDDQGAYSLPPLPLGSYTVQVQGDYAIDGPFTQTFGVVELDAPTQAAPPFVVVRREPRIPINPIQGGTYTFPSVPGSEIVIGPEGQEFPSEIGLTLLPVNSLPQPAASSRLTLVAAAELQPENTAFTKKFILTLPNLAAIPLDTSIFLGCLRINNLLGYQIRGFGNVSQDGLTMTVMSFEPTMPERCSILGLLVPSIMSSER